MMTIDNEKTKNISVLYFMRHMVNPLAHKRFLVRLFRFGVALLSQHRIHYASFTSLSQTEKFATIKSLF